jgi:NodT family efflux transporter outer membrane factor (OMF) lipoprotein
MFREPELDALQARLNISNQTIAAAFENYMAARAQVRGARAGYFPTVTANPDVTRSRSSVTSSTFYSATADVSWAPDLFGRVRNAVRQRKYAAQVSAADLESTRLLAQSALAQMYFQIRGQDALQVLLDATVVANEKIFVLTRWRYERGLDPAISVIQAELILQDVRVQATNTGIRRAQLEHAIATLLGVPATEFALPRRALLATPPAIPTGTPSHLLERRPDIASAERQMASANAAIGIGYAAYYPLVTLSGGVGVARSTLGHLFTWPSRVWSIGANIAQTLFDGGARRANIDQLIAAYNAIVANYRQTVLAAFQQVEDTLAQTRILERAIEQQRTAVALAQKAFDLEKIRYEAGLDPYIDLMLQQTALLAEQQTLVNLNVQQMTSAVQLVEALGGGWDRFELPTPSEVSEPPRNRERQIRR